MSDAWRADELYLKVKGDMKYLFALMDDETRFWIAQEVADIKYKHDARRLFQMGKEAAGKKPTKLIADDLYAYRDAFRKEFYSYRGARVEHIHSVAIRGDRNNKMGRLGTGEGYEGAEEEGCPDPDGVSDVPQLPEAA